MRSTNSTSRYGDQGAATTTIIEAAGHGGRLAMIFSALALLFSGYTFYESALKAPNLEVHIPPVINYARDEGGRVEVLAIPITVANSGARTGTVLSMELEVNDPKAGTPRATTVLMPANIRKTPVQQNERLRLLASPDEVPIRRRSCFIRPVTCCRLWSPRKALTI